MQLSDKGIELLKKIEGYRSTPYPDAGGYSIGFGHFIKKGENINYLSYDEALKLLKLDLAVFEKNIRSKINVPLNQNMFDALVLWNYNTGRESSTLFDLINAKAPIAEIIKFWTTHYITSEGKELMALVNRRLLEARLFASAATTSFFPLILVAATTFFFSEKGWHKING